MFYVYILLSHEDQTSYIGSTKNLERRIEEHNIGKSRSTRNKRPWILVHYEVFKTRAEAVRKELYYKSVAGRLELKKKSIIR